MVKAFISFGLRGERSLPKKGWEKGDESMNLHKGNVSLTFPLNYDRP